MITREMTCRSRSSCWPSTARRLDDVRRVATHPHADGAVPALVRAAPAGRRGRAHRVDGARGRHGRRARTRAYDAAISAPVAAEHYRLATLATGIGDNPDAVTRFVLVSRPGPPPPPTGRDKTSLVAFMREDHPGALLEILDQLAVRGVNLTRIESRPTGAALGNYCFSIDARATSTTPGSGRR